MESVPFLGSGCSFLLFFSVSCALGSGAGVSLVDSLVSKLLVDLGVLEISSDGLDLASSGDGWKSKDAVGGVLGSILKLISSGVVDLTLLWLVSSSWEKDQLGLVLVQSFNVGLHFVSILVVSSVVNSDSYCSGKGLSQSSGLKLSEGETSSELGLSGVPSSLAEYNWSKLANWGSSEGSSSGSSFLGSQLFVSWLVEEASDSSHPMLPQVGALKCIIVFYHVAY